jgi:serine/threonine-protein kinase
MDENKPFAVQIAASVRALGAASDDPWIDRKIGAWTIVRRIGTGGMGAVFLANRSDEQFAQTAAIKIMTASMLGREAVVRFRAERQILANLNHRNIAKLIDGGAVETDLPYLVMEYVDGERIDDYCDQNRLTVAARLQLIQKICAAVDYAHRNLVVHRDLKPSNILIDSDGEPRLLDFGIAKLLEPGAYDMTLAETGAGAHMMTPEYASPEQVRGEAASVATDVYAIGVLLFRLLTGVSPYQGSTSNRRELETAILGASPKRPSTVIGQEAASGTSAGASSSAKTERVRRVSLDGLRRSLSGDIDNIVLKCLQKDPARRYATARELAADIDRHLHQRPVLARGDSWIYTTERFIKRRALPLAAAAVVTLTLIGMSALYTVRVVEERDRAQFAARQAEAVSSFLSSLFESASPLVAKGEEITAVDLLDQGELQIDALADDPLLQAELYRVMGKSYVQLGEADKGLEILRISVARLEAADGADPLALADAVLELAEAYRHLERHNESILGWRRVLALRETALGTDHPDVAFAMARLGAALGSQGRSREALVLIEQALEIKRRHGEEDAELLQVLGALAVNLARNGQYRKADEINQRLMKLSENMIGERHPNTFIRIGNTGIHLHQDYRSEEGLRLLDRSIGLSEGVYPADHPDRAYNQRWRARMLQRLGRFEEAAQALNVAAAITREGGREGTMEWAHYLSGLGNWRLENGDPTAAAAFREALELAVKNGADDAPTALVSRIGLGAALARADKLPEAEQHLNFVLEHRRRYQRSYEWRAERALASLLSQQGRFEEASALFDNILAEQQHGPDDLSGAALEVLIDQAAHYRRAGELEAALFAARRAGEIGRDVLPADNWIIALADAEAGRALLEQGDAAEAASLLKPAVERLRVAFGTSDFRVQKLEVLLSSVAKDGH